MIYLICNGNEGRYTMSDVFRLAPPKKKGIMSLVFSRFSIIALLILLQIALYVIIYGWLIHLLPFFSVFLVIFTLLMVFYLFNNSMAYSAKLT